MVSARQHAIELEQCALFVDSRPLAKAMTDAAAFLRAEPLARAIAALVDIEDVARRNRATAVTDIFVIVTDALSEFRP